MRDSLFILLTLCPLFVLLLLVWLQAGYVSAGGSFVFDRVFDEVLSMLTAPMRADIDATPFIDADMRTPTLCVARPVVLSDERVRGFCFAPGPGLFVGHFHHHFRIR